MNVQEIEQEKKKDPVDYFHLCRLPKFTNWPTSIGAFDPKLLKTIEIIPVAVGKNSTIRWVHLFSPTGKQHVVGFLLGHSRVRSRA